MFRRPFRLPAIKPLRPRYGAVGLAQRHFKALLWTVLFLKAVELIIITWLIAQA